MLTKKQVSWKNKKNALAWCKSKGFRYLYYGAFDVFFVAPEQEGKKMQSLVGKVDAYSSINWLDLFKELDIAKIKKVRS